MPRYFLELAYYGKSFHGWQKQNNAISVQETLDNCLKTLLKQEIESMGCGRTDTGVHASQFYVHFDSDNLIPDTVKFIYHLNAMLPKSIAIYSCFQVNDDAHARFDATLRSYSYYIQTVKDPFLNPYTYFFPFDLDIEKMNLAASTLLTHNDFACFAKAGAQSHTNLCQISYAQWKTSGNMLYFSISANRFLRGMVRAIVGTMIDVGQNKISVDEFKNILTSGNRNNAGPTVAADGLFLEEIKYPYITSARKTPFTL